MFVVGIAINRRGNDVIEFGCQGLNPKDGCRPFGIDKSVCFRIRHTFHS
jgi:hypothetical protein